LHTQGTILPPCRCAGHVITPVASARTWSLDIYDIATAYRREVLAAVECARCGFVVPYDGKGEGIVVVDTKRAFTVDFLLHLTYLTVSPSGFSASAMSSVVGSAAVLPHGASRCFALAPPT